MENLKLKYGMKLLIKVYPISYNFMGMFGVASSMSEQIETEFTVEKYWKDDVDPMDYKVKCVPIDNSGKFGVQSFYSSDLIRHIEDGIVKIIPESPNNWIPFVGAENIGKFNKLLQTDGDCLVKFDDGTICRYYEEHPFAVLTHFK